MGGALAGEGTCDFFLPYFDVFPTRDVFADYLDREVREGTAEVIPLFQYALGDLQVTRNQNHEPIGLAPELDRLFSARALLWGAVPVFRFPQNLEGEPPAELRHFKRIARARARYGNRFVARGRLLRSPRIETDTVELHGHRGVVTAADVIQASAWKSDTGELGVFLLNISPTEDHRTVRYDPQTQPFVTSAGEKIRYVVRNGTYERVVSPTGVLDLTVTSGDVVLLVEAPDSDGRRAALEAIIDAEEEVDGPSDEDVLATAKRALEAEEFEAALDRAERVIQSKGGPTTTSGEAPGFTSVSALAGIGAALFRGLLRDNDTEND